MSSSTAMWRMCRSKWGYWKNELRLNSPGDLVVLPQSLKNSPLFLQTCARLRRNRKINASRKRNRARRIESENDLVYSVPEGFVRPDRIVLPEPSGRCSSGILETNAKEI